MAKFLSIEGTLSGSFNGVTYSHNKGGAYKRARKIPTISASAKQAFSKALLGGISAAWAGLTDIERAQWGDYGTNNPISDVLGQSIQLSGQQTFLRLNMRLVGSGQAIITAPPVVPGPNQLTTLDVTVTAPDGISADFTPPLPTGGTFCLWQCLPGSPGADPNFNQARLIGYSAVNDATPATFTTPYPASPGNAINFWATVMDGAGLVAPAIKDRVIVP